MMIPRASNSIKAFPKFLEGTTAGDDTDASNDNGEDEEITVLPGQGSNEDHDIENEPDDNEAVTDANTSEEGFDEDGLDFGPLERKKRSLGENQTRQPHSSHKRFNKQRLEEGKLPYQVISVVTIKERLTQNKSKDHSSRHTRSGEFQLTLRSF